MGTITSDLVKTELSVEKLSEVLGRQYPWLRRAKSHEIYPPEGYEDPQL